MSTRRSFLTGATAVGTFSIAGCLSRADVLGESDDDPTPDPDSTAEPPAEPDGGPDNLPGETVADFETLAEWPTMIDAGEASPETEDVYTGSQSARITADGETDYAAVYRTFPDGLDLRGKNLSLAVKYTGHEQLDLTVQLLAPNSRNVLGLRRILTGPADRWQRVDLGANRVDTQPDLRDVQEVRIVGRRRGDDGPIDFLVDDLRAVDRPDAGSVLLLFDGTLESHYTHAFDVLEEYGHVGVEAVIPETVGRDGRLTLDVMRELHDAGWDMAARPRTGAQFMHEFSPEEQEGMIRRTKSYLESRDFPDGARTFVAPKNLLGPESIDLVREYHEQAFRYGGAPNGLPVTDPHNLGTFSGSDVGEATHFLDLAAEYGQLAAVRFGEIGGDGIDVNAFRDVLDHVDERGLEVVTASDLLDS